MFTPNPSTGYGIHDGVDKWEQAVGGESPTLSASTRNDCGAGGGEWHLKEEPREELSHQRITWWSVHEEITECEEWTCVLAAPKHQTEAENVVAETAEAHVDHVLHHNIDFVFGTHDTRLDECEASLHGEDDERCDEGPCCIFHFYVVNACPEKDSLKNNHSSGMLRFLPGIA